MDNETKAKTIREWIDPEERVTVDFDDAKDLNAAVTGCNAEVVTLSLETPVPHLRQDMTIPLGKVEVGEDRAKYTRDPEKPLRYGRLRLTIHQNRPEVV